MDNITVVIPHQEYKDDIYGDNNNCYLATALKEAGYQNIRVYGFGKTKIDGTTYNPKSEFDSRIVEEAFEKGQSIEVVLIPIIS